MATKMFKNERIDQLKERTSNMFQQCGGSGGSVAVKEITEPHYYYSPQVTDMKICTLESTYRSHHSLHMPGSRHCVSDSNLFIHQESDWYRPPRSLACDYSGISSAPRNINIVSERYPTADDSQVETITTRFQTPGNILVRFKTFLGIDGSTQRVEVIRDNTDYGSTVITADDSGAVRMKTLFGMKGFPAKDNSSSNTEGDSSTINTLADKVKTLIKAKRSKRKVEVEATSTADIDTNDRIIRMKTLFGNRAPKHVLQIESQTTTGNSKKNLGRFKTLFRSDASSQTDGVPPAHDFIRKASVDEAALSKRYQLKKFLGWTNDQQENDVVVKDFDDRHVFSRQSNPPIVSLEPEVAPRRLPIWLDGFTKRARASCSGARINDIELPDSAMGPKQLRVPGHRRRKLGSTSGWQWRHGEEVTQTHKRHSGLKSWFDCKKCRLPMCSSRTSSIIRNPPPGEPVPIVEVIALICGVLVVVLMALGLGSADWLMAAGWRQGLFTHCLEEGAPTPLPFNLVELPGCYASRDVAYIRAAAALCIVTLIADVIGSILTALGLHATEHRTKYKYYRLAVLAMALALISILIALVIYPVCFAAELNLGNRTVWEFGWAYGVGWGAAIFLFGAVILLLCDKESEEIYYKERKVEREPPGGGP